MPTVRGGTLRNRDQRDLSLGLPHECADGLTDPDSVPELGGTTVSRTGDIWTLGQHKILCGDSTKKDDVDRLMNGETAVLMNTDPPYGVSYGDIANSRLRAIHKAKGELFDDYDEQSYAPIINDDLSGEKLQKFLEDAIRCALPHLSKTAAFYLWHPMLTQGTFFAAAVAVADILIHRQIIWVKPSLIMGRGDYHWRHELCFYGWVQGNRLPWYGNRKQDTVWQIGRENDKIHPTQKPTELFCIPLRNHTVPGEICYEPFSGSGSQIIAAEMLGRRCRAIEIEPKYCDVAVIRWERFVGDRASLERNGNITHNAIDCIDLNQTQKGDS